MRDSKLFLLGFVSILLFFVTASYGFGNWKPNHCPLAYGAEQEYPQRIISLGPALSEELYLLGAQDRLIGVTTYCQRPALVQKKEKVGTVTEVNLEKIIQLKPDLVLTTSLTSPKAKEKLRNLGIKLADFPYAKNFSQVCEQFLGLAKLIGKEKEAQEIVQTAKARVDFIRASLKGLARPKVFIQIGAKPLFTATKDSFINDFIEFAGGINIAGNSRGGLYSKEKVVKDNPEVIIIATMGIVGEKEKEVWRQIESLKAVRDERIYIIDSYRLCSPTPVSFIQTLEELVGLLHPESK